MSCTIGRCALTEDPYNIKWEGDQWSFEIDIVGVAQAGTVVDDYKAKVQQLRGLMDNPDEDVFPVTWSEDATVDGFYRDIRVQITPFSVYLATGAGTATVSMTRVVGAAAALFEATATAVVMTNSFGVPVSSPNGLVALPYTDLQEASPPTNIVTGGVHNTWATSTSFTADSGLVRCNTSGLSGGTVARWRWYTPPAFYYNASCKVEQSFGGTYYPLHGSQALVASNAWRISNGLVRVSLSATTIDVSHYDGSAWDTAKSWSLGVGGSPSMTVAPVMRVTKNTAHCVSVKVAVGLSSGVSSTTLEMTLRRGMRMVSFSLISNITTEWSVESGEASTALTGGFRTTSTDAAGNRAVVASPSGQTNTLAAGELKLTTAATTFRFGIGSDVGATGAGQDLIDRYMTDISEVHRCISR